MTAALPYGSWPSPVSAAHVATSSPRLERAQFVGDDIWWGQSVATEGGRTTVMRRTPDDECETLLPAPWNARSAVHEYGGDAWTATSTGALVFVEKSDQRVWMLDQAEPRPLTPATDGFRFGGLRIAGDLLLAVREMHARDGRVTRDIVAVPLDGAAAEDPDALAVLATGSDFLAQPALSPDGTTLAWVAWSHPHMPWDETTLRVRRLDVADTTGVAVAGGAGTVPLQPVWTGDDELTFVDDPTGRWNLRRVRVGAESVPIAPADADTGGGLWVLGLRWFGVLDDGRIVAVRTNGGDEVVVVDAHGQARPLAVDAIANTVIEDVKGSRVLISTTGADGGASVWSIDVDDPAATRRVAGGESAFGEDWMPRGRPVTVPGLHGDVHAFDFPPTHPDTSAPEGELPPYVVFVHGGPTSHVGGAASGKISYFTSRGIGVLDVNYGGSTGYGRAYRERLRGMWGIVDVDDVVAAARGLADAGVADARRLAIAGGSAGGWTVLCALAQTNVFGAGISRYGVADLRLLAEDTHDFEARYLDSLVGPLPEAEQLYVERSPLSHLEGFTTPMLIEQGLDDHVVPPSQSEAVRDALASNGVAHAYLAFEGEGHGFRRAETIVATLEAEIAFLGAVFGFTPDGVPPISLE